MAQSGPRVNNFIRSSKGDFDIVLLGYATNIIGALITGLAKVCAAASVAGCSKSRAVAPLRRKYG